MACSVCARSPCTNLSPASYGTCPSFRKYLAPDLDFMLRKFSSSFAWMRLCSFVMRYPLLAIRMAGASTFFHSSAP